MKRKILLVTPVYNEETVLEQSIKQLHEHMTSNIRDDWGIIIAENGSTDATSRIADKIAEKLPHIRAIHFEYQGRGNALKQVWSSNTADVYAYCDIDLATDPSHLKELFDSISEGYDISLGTRYMEGAKSKRTIKRLVLSKGYISLTKLFFKTRISDFQCGFKSVSNRVVGEILPKVQNKGWFFDTELLLIAEQSGKYKIKEIPVSWHENTQSKVNVIPTIYEYTKSLIELKRRMTGGADGQK